MGRLQDRSCTLTLADDDAFNPGKLGVSGHAS